MKPARTLIVIADGARARFLEHGAIGRPLAPAAAEAMEGDRRPTHELGVERPGRTHDRFGPGRHALEPRADWHDLEKTRFAAAVAERIGELKRNGRFDRIVLIAAPRALGEIRAALAGDVSAIVVAEIAKDLTHATDEEVARHLGTVMAL